MSLHKSVLMDDGVVRRYHKIFNIQHILDQATYVEVVSYQFDDSGDEVGAHTMLTHDFDDDLTFAEAYEWVDSLPMFQEYSNDTEAEISQLAEQLTEANATIAEKDSTIETMTVAYDDISSKFDIAVSVLTDDQAITIQTIFPAWNENEYYSEGTRVLYNDILYRCLQPHQSQVNWAPSDAPSLWTRCHQSEIDPSVPEEWFQPDSTNPYMMGDIVTHNGSTWRSTVDNNVWEPGVYGWDMFVA